MTTDELGLELTGQTSTLTAAEVLNICDRILGEPARRRHFFAWLRARGAASDEWLPVDGYYPGSKLVVVWHATPTADDRVYSELVPAHGFRLLELTPAAVGGDRDQAEAQLRARIEALGAAPRRTREPRTREPQPPDARAAQRREIAVAGAVRSFAPPAGAAAAEAAPLGARFGAVLGVVLTVALVAELYLGVAVVGFGHGQPVLALAFALGGSPLVATFASSQRQGQVAAEPTPLAGVVSLLAMALAVIGVLLALASG